MSNPILTIGIPTYNRADKLGRLLEILKFQVLKDNLFNLIEIFVSDNCSSDETSIILQSYKIQFENFDFSYLIQDCNRGFDTNVLTIYKKAKGKYVWLLADDDIPLNGTIINLIKNLIHYEPNVLLFSFGQPPGSKKGVYNFDIPVYVSTSLSEAIELILRWPKISVYVLKKIDFNIEDQNIIKMFTNLGWHHVIIALSILNNYKVSNVAIISEILAVCDEDFDMLTWSPISIINSARIAEHPLILNILPQLYIKKKQNAYLESIQFCFAAKIGTLRVKNMNDYDIFIKNLNYDILLLISNPKSLIQLFLLKSNLTFIYIIKLNFIKILNLKKTS